MRKNQSDPPEKTTVLRWGILLCTALLIAGCIAGTAAAADTDADGSTGTAVLVFTDWHAHTGQTNAMIQAVNDEARKAANVIVCFNGDSENCQPRDDYNKTVRNTVKQWNINHQYVTPFMQLADELLKNPKVTIVMGLGNHELGLNPKGAKSSENLAEYIGALKTHLGKNFNHRFYVINTELQWKSGGDMARLYGTTVHRSMNLHNITFLSVMGPNVMSKEVGSTYNKGKLYENVRITYTLTGKVSEITSSLHDDASCVLLAHAGYDKIDTLLKHMHLKKNTYLFTGHDHQKPYTKHPDGIKASIQPDKYGKGVSVLYADLTGKWTDTPKNLPLRSNEAQNSITTEIIGADPLTEVRNNPGGTYTLAADINLSGDWTPIGTADDPFTGIFDGGGHTIRGLNISTAGFAGFFGYTSGAVIRNLNLEVQDITGSGGIGGVAGFSESTTLENISVRINGVITAHCPDTGWYTIGGVAGLIQESTLQNISVLISGSLIGPAEEPWESEDPSSDVGGAVGFNNGGLVQNTSVVIAGEIISAANQVGGLIGCNDGILITSSATGNVSGIYQVGGLAGSNYGTISDVYFIGNVTVGVTAGDSDGASLAGGLAGFNEGVIRRAYTAGTVDTAGTGAGGFAGEVFDDDPDPAAIHLFSTIEDSASFVQSVTGADPETGGFVGSGYRYEEGDPEIWGIITDCFTQSAITVNGEPVSESIRTGTLTDFPEFWNNEAFYQNLAWSFMDDWQMNTNPLFRLPVLRQQSLPAAGDLSCLIPRHTVTVEVNDGTMGVLVPDTGTQSVLTPETYSLEVFEGADVTFRIVPVFGNTTTRLTVDGTDLNPVPTTCSFRVTGDHTLTAEFGPVSPGEPSSPRSVDADVPQESKDQGVEAAVVRFDGADTPGTVAISVQTETPAENYGPIPENRNTKLIIQISSSTQPQSSSANVSISINRRIVPNPDTVAIYHNVLTDAVQNIWTQQPVANLTYRVEADVVVFSFLTPTFSYFTVTEAMSPSSGSDSDTAANTVSAGQYVRYPRTVENGGLVTFGTSPVVTSIEMPAGYSGQVVLIMEPGPNVTDMVPYTEFTLTVPGYPAGDASLLNLRIPLTDPALQGYDAADIHVYRFGNDTWEVLPGTDSREDSGYAYAQVRTTGPGSFVVVLEKEETAGPVETEPPLPPGTPAVPVTEATTLPSPTSTPPDSAPQPTQSSLTLFSGIAGLGAVVILRRKEK